MYDSYYAMTSSKRNGTTIEEEMKKRGYVKDYYIGSGAYHWKKENQKGWWFITHDHFDIVEKNYYICVYGNKGMY